MTLNKVVIAKCNWRGAFPIGLSKSETLFVLKLACGVIPLFYASPADALLNESLALRPYTRL